MLRKIIVGLIAVVMAVQAITFVPITAKAENAEEIYYGTSGFAGSTYQYSDSRTITYDHRVVEELQISYGLPNYRDRSSRENTCSNVAGAIICGYYDRLFPNLIPNFTAGVLIGSRYFYLEQAEVIDNLMLTLYCEMQTNIVHQGTTATNTLNGLNSYISGVGVTVSYTSVVTNGVTNYSFLSTAVTNEKPLIYFLSAYNLVNFSTNYFQVNSSQDTINMNIYQGNHVIVVYGYLSIKYYDENNNLLRQDNYLKVASGLEQSPFVYILMEDRTTVNEGYIVDIS